MLKARPHTVAQINHQWRFDVPSDIQPQPTDTCQWDTVRLGSPACQFHISWGGRFPNFSVTEFVTMIKWWLFIYLSVEYFLHRSIGWKMTLRHKHTAVEWNLHSVNWCKLCENPVSNCGSKISDLSPQSLLISKCLTQIISSIWKLS